MTTQIQFNRNVDLFSPTSSDGGVALQAMNNRHSPETKSNESTNSSSPSDQNRNHNDHAASISNGDSAPNNHRNEPDAQNPEVPSPRHPAATVDEPPRPLRWWDVSSLIINKMIGTGIYTSPPAVLILTGNKREALGLWITGFVYTVVR